MDVHPNVRATPSIFRGVTLKLLRISISNIEFKMVAVTAATFYRLDMNQPVQ